MLGHNAQVVLPVQSAPHLYLRVRTGFVSLNETLHGWCSARNYSQANVRRALLGEWRGPRARAICDEIRAYLKDRGVQL